MSPSQSNEGRVISDRERFLSVLYTGPLLRADAIVLLTGDGTARIPAALELFKMQHGEAQIVVTGGLDNPPSVLKASAMAAKLFGHGVKPSKVTIDDQSMHTREQAVVVISAAVERKWKALLLVASAYHMPRAFLTFLQELQLLGLEHEIRLVPVPASQAPWWEQPAGLTVTRFALLDEEFAKVEQYAAKGHVASFEDGLAYLEYWEGR